MVFLKVSREPAQQLVEHKAMSFSSHRASNVTKTKFFQGWTLGIVAEYSDKEHSPQVSEDGLGTVTSSPHQRLEDAGVYQ